MASIHSASGTGGGQRGISRANLITFGVGAFLIASVVGGMTYSVIDLHREASEARDAQTLLLGLRSYTFSEAIEMSLGLIRAESTASVDEIDRYIETNLGQLPPLDDLSRLRAGVKEALLTYFSSVQAEAEAIAEGADATALTAAAERIEADELKVNDVLDGAADQYQDHAAELDNTANIELVAMMSLVILIVGLLVRRAQRISQSAERKASEQRRHAEARFRSLVQNSSDAILILEADTTVRFASPSVERVLGLEAPDLEGTQLTRFVHEDDAERVVGFCAAADETEEEGEVAEFRLQTKSGDWLIVEAIRNDLRTDPNVGGTVLNLRDVTEQKKLEAQIRQSQKMEAVGQLAGGVAHDFNNLLTIILGNIIFLEREIQEGDPKREDLDSIKAAAERAKTLTRQLLVYSRKELIRLEVLDPNRILRDVEGLLRRTLPATLELSIRTAPDLKPVRMDSGQLEQVVMNLVVNARDAMPEGGRVTIETANVEVEKDYADLRPGLSPGPHVCISVSDTGTGMTKEVMARIFEPFYTTKPRGTGTGLGLATVYGIVKRFKGYVSVHSALGKGTSFKVFLPITDESIPQTSAEPVSQPAAGPVSRTATKPAAHPPAQPAPETSAEAAQRATLGGDETILIVEDEVDLARMTRRILERVGYRISVATSGDEAVALSSRHEGEIHLVLTDVVMPGMSIRDMVDELGDKHPGLQVIYMSGYTDDTVAGQGVLEEGVVFIQKPFTMDDLLTKVREALDARISQRANLAG